MMEPTKAIVVLHTACTTLHFDGAELWNISKVGIHGVELLPVMKGPVYHILTVLFCLFSCLSICLILIISFLPFHRYVTRRVTTQVKAAKRVVR